MAHLFRARVRLTPDREAYRYPVAPGTEAGVGETWASRTWLETGECVTRLAAGLVALRHG